MQYIFLIYSQESEAPEFPTDPAGIEAYMAPWHAYDNALKEAGVFRGGEALELTDTATTVSMAPGRPDPVLTDGPFAETKEQLGGFYLVDCKDLEEALGWAAKCPAAEFGKVEVRPIMALDG